MPVLEETRTERWVEGDAGAHLEDLVVGQLPTFDVQATMGTTAEIQLVGAHLRMSGMLDIGHFRRVSDYVNNHEGLINVRNAMVLRRNGDPTKVTAPSIWVTPNEITLVAIVGEETRPPDNSMVAERVPRTLIVVTPGHTLTGNIHIAPEAQLAMVIESPTPAFIPMTDVRTRSLADRRVISRFQVAMLNRRHIVAATELQPGMIPGRTVL